MRRQARTPARRGTHAAGWGYQPVQVRPLTPEDDERAHEPRLAGPWALALLLLAVALLLVVTWCAPVLEGWSG